MNLYQMIHAMAVTPGCLPVLLHGESSTAKTSRVRQLAQKMNRRLITVIAAAREPADIAGLPIPDMETGVFRYMPGSWAKDAAGTDAIVFFDEFNLAGPAMFAATLRVLLEKVVGDLPLGDAVYMMAACNPLHEAAGGSVLPTATANRFLHLEVDYPGLDEWVDFMTTQIQGSEGDLVDTLPTLDLAAWRMALGGQIARVRAFLQAKPNHWHEPASIVEGLPLPNLARPRTWEAAARLRATAQVLGYAWPKLVESAIGPRVTKEFVVYDKELDIDPEAMLQDPQRWKPRKDRPDLVYAELISMGVAAVMSGESKALPEVKLRLQKRWDAAFEILERAEKTHRHMVFMTARQMVRSRPSGVEIQKDQFKLLAQFKQIMDKTAA